MALGEKIGEEKGKVIGISVKSVGPDGVHLENTFATEVKGFGRWPSGRNIGTMELIHGLGGAVSLTGQGIFTSLDGDSVVWKCYGLGKSEAGKTKGVIIIQNMTSSQKLSWMNGSIVVEEGITDQKMEISGTIYEWK